ncbi:MAG: GatB/YqeY domain-containing protein [Bacteroidales bacterium]|nr:GatB/YqeY domain-containing protein [Bacteroidales bacterium]
MLTETINEAIKQAMLQKEKEKLNALRAIKSELLLLKADNPGTEITEEMEIKMLQRMIKQRKEAAETYKSQNREDLYKEESQQAEVIASYLPAQLSEAEIEAAIRQIIAESGVTDIKGMGKVMGLASKALAGKAENKIIADKVKAMLS